MKILNILFLTLLVVGVNSSIAMAQTTPTATQDATEQDPEKAEAARKAERRAKAAAEAKIKADNAQPTEEKEEPTKDGK